MQCTTALNYCMHRIPLFTPNMSIVCKKTPGSPPVRCRKCCFGDMNNQLRPRKALIKPQGRQSDAIVRKIYEDVCP